MIIYDNPNPLRQMYSLRCWFLSSITRADRVQPKLRTAAFDRRRVRPRCGCRPVCPIPSTLLNRSQCGSPTRSVDAHLTHTIAPIQTSSRGWLVLAVGKRHFTVSRCGQRTPNRLCARHPIAPFGSITRRHLPLIGHLRRDVTLTGSPSSGGSHTISCLTWRIHLLWFVPCFFSASGATGWYRWAPRFDRTSPVSESARSMPLDLDRTVNWARCQFGKVVRRTRDHVEIILHQDVSTVDWSRGAKFSL